MKTSAELRFGFWDVTARGDATLSSSGNQPFSSLNGLNVDDPNDLPAVATLEAGVGWPLNGTRHILPDKGGPYGWWTTVRSGADGRFATAPTLTITFTKPHSSIGITLNFVNSLPETVTIKWYGLTGALLSSADFHPTALNFFCDQQVEGYAKLVISVPKMREAGRFLRVSHLIFGVLEILKGKRLQSAVMTEEIDCSGLTLPTSTLNVVFCTPDSRFSLTDLSGAYRLFQRRQPIESYETIDGAVRYLGVQYFSELSATVDGVTGLACTDILGVLENIEFMGGIYDKYPISALLNDLLSSEGISYTLGASLQGATLSGHLPIASKRTALRYLAFAVGAVVDTTRQDGISLYALPTAITQTIPPSRKVVGHMLKLEPLVTQVRVTAHAYRLTTEVRQLVSARYEAGTHTIRFSTPAEVSAVTGGTVIKKNQNHVVIRVTAAGDVVVTGREYADDKTMFTASAGQLWAGERESVKVVEDATLVDRDKGQAVADRLLGWYQNRYTDEGTILPGAERVGAVTALENIGGRTIVGAVERMSLDLTGGYLARITMRGR